MCARRIPASLPIDPGFLSQLRGHVAAREIARGLACLQSHQELIARIDPSQENASRLLTQLAIWTDIGFNAPPLKKGLLRRFESVESGSRSKLPSAITSAAHGRGDGRNGRRSHGGGNRPF